MIGNTLKELVKNLNVYLGDIYTPNVEYAWLKQAQEDMFSNANEKIVVSLINMEEDTVYKNQPTAFDSGNANLLHPYGGKPTIRLNLYVLFVCNPGDDEMAYVDAMTMLSHIVRYFKTYPAQELSIIDMGTPKTVNLEIEFFNISLEDSNNMWSNLGGQQMPYGMYCLKLLEIESDDPDNSALATAISDPRIMDPDTNSQTIKQI